MRRPVFFAFLLAAVVVGLVVLRLVQPGFDARYQSFDVTPTLDEAREAGTLVAEYRADPLTDDAPAVEAVYADRPTRLTRGWLLQTEPVTAQAVRVTARLAADAERRGLWLAFDDRAGVTLDPDGAVHPDRGGSPASDRIPCCYAFRAQAPAQFWLERDGERILSFTRQP